MKTMTKIMQEFNAKCTETTDVNSLLLAFTGKCSKLMDAHIPSKMTSQRLSQAWIDKEIKQMSQKKKTILSEIKKERKSKRLEYISENQKGDAINMQKNL
jgi:hypothetical protein